MHSSAQSSAGKGSNNGDPVLIENETGDRCPPNSACAISQPGQLLHTIGDCSQSRLYSHPKAPRSNLVHVNDVISVPPTICKISNLEMVELSCLTVQDEYCIPIELPQMSVRLLSR